MKQSRFIYAPKWPLALATVSAIALSGGAALAQDPSPAAEDPGPRGVRTKLETVVTQAQKIESSAQTTPVATTTIEGDTLARAFVVDLRDLTKLGTA